MYIFRLHSTYTEQADGKGVDLYDDYVTTCSKNNIKPNSANFVGKMVSCAFPNCQAKRVRSKQNWNIFQRRYIGLKIRDDPDLDLEPTDFHLIQNCLSNNMYIMENGDDYVLVGCKTMYFCQGHRAGFEIKILKNSEVKVALGTISINLSSYGLHAKLPKLTKRAITALLRGVQSLQLCCGKESALVDTNKTIPQALQVSWCKEGGVSEKRIQSRQCKGVLSPTHHAKICVSCQLLFRGRGGATTEPQKKHPRSPLHPFNLIKLLTSCLYNLMTFSLHRAHPIRKYIVLMHVLEPHLLKQQNKCC